MDVRKELLMLADTQYRDFHKKLIPNVPEERILGVRIPQLRKLGKKLDKDNFAWEYYEEVMLHVFYIGYKKLDFEARLTLLNEFIPRIDNWAVCDCAIASMKFIEKSRKAFLDYLQTYMRSQKEYELRFAVVVLMDYYLTDEYIDMSLAYLQGLQSDFYYVNMAVAWALSVAFVRYRDRVLPILESRLLSREVQNMTIGKIRDSLRVDKETKQYVKSLRI